MSRIKLHWILFVESFGIVELGATECSGVNRTLAERVVFQEQESSVAYEEMS